MALLSKQDVTTALTRMGEIAASRGDTIELVLLGGSLMVLLFGTREATRDVDVVILVPEDSAYVRELAKMVAEERSWPADWLNDAAKGFVVGPVEGTVILTGPGITVRRPSIAQLLAMKLCAWRDDIDIADARRLLEELSGTAESVWNAVSEHLQPGRELKARYAFDDLWEDLHGPH